MSLEWTAVLKDFGPLDKDPLSRERGGYGERESVVKEEDLRLREI